MWTIPIKSTTIARTSECRMEVSWLVSHCLCLIMMSLQERTSIKLNKCYVNIQHWYELLRVLRQNGLNIPRFGRKPEVSNGVLFLIHDSGLLSCSSLAYFVARQLK